MTTYTSRAEVPTNEKWNLEDIYSDESKWEADLQQIEEMAGKLKKFDGAIQDGASLYQFLKQQEE
ncbi:MAG TPA: oligoendopeptidase F, partial [Pseudoneobacillus sp.]|nr:oligoendopeptidase F [Pseudoneobacillus sp.]